MTRLKMHLVSTAITSRSRVVTYCGAWLHTAPSRLRTTTDLAEVTCARCRELAGKS